MAHFWLISAPGENGSKEDTWKSLQRATNELSTNYKLKVPELRVGTLDSLMTLSDDLERIDRYKSLNSRRSSMHYHQVIGREVEETMSSHLTEWPALHPASHVTFVSSHPLM
mmetsp:Transcript_34626/g.54058  ORF Transcript_34626/g.54058 Transcript_34626/m.54058 type:complete len:112 (+) Transcript_34626:109-444(+)